MKLNKSLISCILTICMVMSLAATASAKEITVITKVGTTYVIGSNDFVVEYNGVAVTFPDAQPYVDENNRTLVPVRFVSETMGATVDWRDSENTAVIAKGTTTVNVTIGLTDLAVIKDGVTSTVIMDTKAVLKDSRTYVPVRYVAEALGAWVGYSDLFNTAQIYSDVLTPTEITRLHNYADLSWDEYIKASSDNAYGVTEASWVQSNPQIAYFIGTGTYGFSNANEWALRQPKGSYSLVASAYPVSSFTGILTRKTFKFGTQPNVDCAKIGVEEAVKGAAAQFTDVIATLRTDLSCVFASRHLDDGSMLVRGVLSITIPANADVSAIASKYGIADAKAGGTYESDVEMKIGVYKGLIGAVNIETL